jgi:hypothetical protein
MDGVLTEVGKVPKDVAANVISFDSDFNNDLLAIPPKSFRLLFLSLHSFFSQRQRDTVPAALPLPMTRFFAAEIKIHPASFRIIH